MLARDSNFRRRESPELQSLSRLDAPYSRLTFNLELYRNGHTGHLARSVVQILAASYRQAWWSIQGPLFLSRLHLAPHDHLYIPTAIKRRIRGRGLTPYYPSLVPDSSADARRRVGPLRAILPAALRFRVSLSFH